MAYRTPAPLRIVGALVRALLGLALLVMLLAGTPYVLLLVGTQPTDLSGGIDVLLRPDDGTLFFTAITCIGWVAWAAFAFSVVLEIVAVARRRSAPRLRGLGGMQSVASFLVGGIVLLAPTAASAATSAPAHAVTATQTAGDSSPSASPSTSASSDDTSGPTHTVTSSTELPWDLAEKYLGSGQRWQDIAALNPDIPGLAAGDQYLPKGAVIKLPADARPSTPAASPSSVPTPAADDRAADSTAHQDEAEQSGKSDHTAAADESKAAARPDHVTVQEGDSLWSIADEYGDPTDWPEIFKENKGEVQPGGGHFTNPDLIIPGQELDLPPADEHADPPAESDKDQDPAPPHEKPTDNNEDTNSGTGTGGEKQDSGHEDDRQEAPATTTPAPSATTQPSTAAPQTPTPAPSSPEAQTPSAAPHEEPAPALAVAPAAIWTGTGVVAAALIGTLAVRRRRQQNRRRPGRRIAMPKGRAAATEQGLRSVQAPTGFDLLNVALRCMALNLEAADRELPVLEAVVLHDTRLELHLAEDTPSIAPFTAAAGRQDLWTCSANHSDLASGEEVLQHADAPYPALVSIGWDTQGRYVLVDLEHVGLLNLAGDPDFARHVLQAVAVELANTPVAGHLEVTALGQSVPGLDTAVPERVARAEDLDEATAELAAHTAGQRRALAALGAATPRAARLRDDTGGDWTPHVVLAQELPDNPATRNLLDTLTEQPRTASAVITASTLTDLPAQAWTLDCQGPDATVVLPGSALPIRLQALGDDHFADAIELLTTADSDTDVPAPAWTGDENADGLLEEDLGEDGLPGEYVEMEQEALTAQPPIPTPAAPKAAVVYPTADGTHEEPAAPSGQSLADVLAEDSETGSDSPTDTKPPAAGPGNVSFALAAPCASPAPAVVHATIPAPAEEPREPSAERPVSEAGAVGPSVLLLGPITIEGATGRVDSNRKSVGTELAAYLALHPGSDHHAIDAALWPSSRVKKDMRNAVISRTRSWLGTDPDGNHHFPRVQDTDDKRYRLGPHVTSDWTQFQRHARKGLTDHGEDGDLALRRALALVRGRPFTGMDPQRYAWAEPTAQEMVSAIVDVAYELSTRRREARDIPGALWAARQGLLAVEESETLHRAVFLAHHAAGDTEALREAAARLRQINDSIGGGVEMEADTAELLRNLLPRPVHSR
ncbi:LysM peptidoglycan-binding domain-containing protein [Streptomyces lutosisoli]|uniref:LysM peptidoglycan-binding domain-containing protein n=1 Tax=Streptomyces lutosisoli TaxID=2665721 RepID=A0ABW2VWY3_9ACTN